MVAQALDLDWAIQVQRSLAFPLFLCKSEQRHVATVWLVDGNVRAFKNPSAVRPNFLFISLSASLGGNVGPVATYANPQKARLHGLC